MEKHIENVKKYKLTITMRDGSKICATNILEKDKMCLADLDYSAPLLLAEDKNGVEISVNLNHAISVQYNLIQEIQNE